VRELVASTMALADALETRFPWAVRTPVAVKLEGEDVLAEAAARAAVQVTDCYLVPYEATAALAMLLLRDHGILTVHFAALPPGTSALLLKFLPPETLERYGGPDRFSGAVDESLDALAALVADRESLAGLLGLPALSRQS
jgi:L-seryl-tRNA(Ser) seleniumtransferase